MIESMNEPGGIYIMVIDDGDGMIGYDSDENRGDVMVVKMKMVIMLKMVIMRMVMTW